MSGRIIVVGSTNTDMVIKADKFPLPGETILGGKFFMNPGGKGANQAVAASRLGGKVTFITKIGNDIFGRQALQQFQNEGIDTRYLCSDPDLPSGVALITVDAKGENSIVVAPGSNGTLSSQDLANAESAINETEILLMQLEIPVATVAAAARIAASAGKKVILNPAPAMTLPDQLFQDLFLITPNKAEAEALTGVDIRDLESAEVAARNLYKKGVANVVITLGATGAVAFDGTTFRHIPAPLVTALDTTAAGDVFNGALAVGIAEGMPLIRAVEFANQAAAVSVTKMGAQASCPYRHEVIVESTI